MKVRKAENNRLIFKCPGCKENHVIRYGDSNSWTWNGSLESPTFQPSVLVTGTRPVTDEEADLILAGEHVEPEPRVCHSFVTDGKIRFLTDCTHELVGQTVDLPEFNENTSSL